MGKVLFSIWYAFTVLVLPSLCCCTWNRGLQPDSSAILSHESSPESRSFESTASVSVLESPCPFCAASTASETPVDPSPQQECPCRTAKQQIDSLPAVLLVWEEERTVLVCGDFETIAFFATSLPQSVLARVAQRGLPYFTADRILLTFHNLRC